MNDRPPPQVGKDEQEEGKRQTHVVSISSRHLPQGVRSQLRLLLLLQLRPLLLEPLRLPLLRPLLLPYLHLLILHHHLLELLVRHLSVLLQQRASSDVINNNKSFLNALNPYSLHRILFKRCLECKTCYDQYSLLNYVECN